MIENEQGVQLIRGAIMVELEDIGEGYNGDWNADNPNDIPLLRFTVSRIENGEPQQIDDASYCTLINAITTTTEQRQRALETIMDRVYDPATAGRSIKRLCEGLSWMDAKGLVMGGALTGTPGGFEDAGPKRRV